MSEAVARVFFALWPDQALRDRLAREAAHVHAHYGGRLTRPETLHLTLLFIGGLERERLPGLLAAARAVKATACEVEFDHADCWRHNRVAHIAARRVPEALLELVKALEATTAAESIAFDHRPYKAHITVARKADCAKQNPALGRVAGMGRDAPEIKPICWAARDFVLLESVLRPEGPSYSVVERFPLL